MDWAQQNSQSQRVPPHILTVASLAAVANEVAGTSAEQSAHTAAILAHEACSAAESNTNIIETNIPLPGNDFDNRDHDPFEDFDEEHGYS